MAMIGTNRTPIAPWTASGIAAKQAAKHGQNSTIRTDINLMRAALAGGNVTQKAWMNVSSSKPNTRLARPVYGSERG